MTKVHPEFRLGSAPSTIRDAGTVALLSAKLEPPVLLHAALLRPRLFALLSRAVQRSPLTLISGPAGSGKTVLAASWRETEPAARAVAWLSLDVYDEDPALFWSYVVEALGSVGVVTTDVPRLVPGEQPPAGFLTALAGAITARPQPVGLIIDNADHITGKGIVDGLDLLIRNAGTRLRLVLCERADPQLPLHQYRLAGTMAEVRGDELAFMADETRDLLSVMGVHVSAEVAGRLCAETQGWAVGLRLAAAPLKQGASPERLVTSLAHDDGSVAQYLFAEVLASQPASVRRLLLRISVTADLDPDLVDRLAGRPNSGRVLAALARANAFVEGSPGPSGGYRIHPLFREMLQAQLAYDHPGEVAGLHRTCAAWYAEMGRRPEAIGHAIAAGDWTSATPLLIEDLVVPRLLAHGSDPVLRSVRMVPPSVGGREAGVLRAAIALAGGSTPSPADRDTTTRAAEHGEYPALRASAALVCLTADTVAGADPARILGRAAAVQAELGTLIDPDRHERREFVAVLAGSRALATLRSDAPAAEVATQLRVAAGAAQAAGTRRLRCRPVGLLALLEALDGQLTRAVQHATEAEALSTDDGAEPADRPVAPAAALAWVHLRRYGLVEAREWLGRAGTRERHLPALPEADVIGAALALVQAESLRLHREYDSADEVLQPAVGDPGLPRWVRQRALVSAARIAFARGRIAEGTALLDDPAVDRATGLRMRALAGLLGGETADAVLPAEDHPGSGEDVIEHRVLRACQLVEAGSVTAAVEE